MSTLITKLRPLVVFDANDRTHRQYFNQFLKTQTWGKCPVRFVVSDSESSNIIGVIQRQLSLYYTDIEFNKRKKER
jgi:hypothetical protein